jgi:hypothetical protein
VSERRKVGRVESGLERDLATRHDIGPSERSALRAQAHGVDMAETAGDSDALSRASAVYLTLREAAGLSAAGSKPVDSIDAFMAELARATPGTRDAADT